MSKRTTTFPGASIIRNANKNFLSFRLQSNGLFTVTEYNYPQGYQNRLEDGFEAVNVSAINCVKIATMFGANYNDLQDKLYQLQAMVEEFQKLENNKPEVVRTENGIEVSGQAAEHFLKRKQEMENKRKYDVACKMFEVFMEEGKCNIHGNEIAGYLTRIIEKNNIPYEIHPFPDYNKFVKK